MKFNKLTILFSTIIAASALAAYAKKDSHVDNIRTLLGEAWEEFGTAAKEKKMNL